MAVAGPEINDASVSGRRLEAETPVIAVFFFFS